MVSNIKTPITLSLFTFQSVSQILVICAYRKIPKMSPSLYKPLQNKYKPPKLITQKNPPLHRPSEYKPPGGLYLKIAL